MICAQGFTPFAQFGFSYSVSFALDSGRRGFSTPQLYSRSPINFRFMVSRITCNQQNSTFSVSRAGKFRDLRLFKSVELDQFITSDDEDEMGDGFFEAIEELERMTREPSDVLEEMNDRLSAREFQLVLVYFSQEGRDSWCALEVFEWLQKENRVDKETMELMVSIMCSWIKKLVEGEHNVGDVVDLLVDMDCVGLKPHFSMIEKVISLYWEMGEKEKAISFVKEVLGRKLAFMTDDWEGHKGGPSGFLAWKMMVSLQLVLTFVLLAIYLCLRVKNSILLLCSSITLKTHV